jgi:tRNA1(Val) A37 N6-methylase TrmN6
MSSRLAALTSPLVLKQRVLNSAAKRLAAERKLCGLERQWRLQVIDITSSYNHALKELQSVAERIEKAKAEMAVLERKAATRGPTKARCVQSKKKAVKAR